MILENSIRVSFIWILDQYWSNIQKKSLWMVIVSYQQRGIPIPSQHKLKWGWNFWMNNNETQLFITFLEEFCQIPIRSNKKWIFVTLHIFSISTTNISNERTRGDFIQKLFHKRPWLRTKNINKKTKKLILSKFCVLLYIEFDWNVKQYFHRLDAHILSQCWLRSFYFAKQQYMNLLTLNFDKSMHLNESCLLLNNVSLFSHTNQKSCKTIFFFIQFLFDLSDDRKTNFIVLGDFIVWNWKIKHILNVTFTTKQ